MKIIDKLLRKKKQRSDAVGMMTGTDLFDSICCGGYTTLDQNPEVLTACRKIADLISSMTIHLMANTNNGDQRIINELSKKIDINPNRFMTRKTWMDAIVMNLLIYGKGNSIVLPKTVNGQLEDLIPIPANNVSFRQNGAGYYVDINGVQFEPEDVLHFVHNPDKNHLWKGKGLTVPLREVTTNLQQAAATEKGFLTDQWKPSVIIKVDGNVSELADESGRDKLLDEYIRNSEVGKPWVIPAELIDVATIKPLTLADLAIKDTVELNKKAVAAILGVPAYIVGAGDYNREEWNNFINSTILPIATSIQQELTKKLLLSPAWYFKFNVSSLYNYDIQTLSGVYSDLYIKGIVDGNEVRDKIGLSPREGLSELVILENYIPVSKIGDQQKLKQEGSNNE